jgi:hypothetical protein
MERYWHRALARLILLQDQRRKGLIAGAVPLPAGCYMDTDGRVYAVVPRVIVAIPEPDLDVDGMEVSPSADRENGEYREQKERGTEAVRSSDPNAANGGDKARGVGLPKPPDSAAGPNDDLSRIPEARFLVVSLIF